MAQRNVGVIGAGPAGMAAAYQLAKEGCKVHVFEASPYVGGMARTFDLWGQKVDVGPHRFFSSDARVNRLWLEVIGRDYKMVDRLTRIFYQGKFFHYPLQAQDALKTLGLAEAARCVASYGKTRLSGGPKNLDSFEDWVVSRFGRRLFEIFFKTYSEKLWGISCQELDSDFAAQRIKKLSLFEAAKAALLGGGGSKHKTLVDRFAYPTEGTGAAYERMAEFVRQKGGTVDMRTPVARVEARAGQPGASIFLDDGKKFDFEYVVSSMPLTLLVERLPDVPAKVLEATRSLTFRNTILVYLNVDSSDLFRDQWLYIHSSDLDTGRITNFRNWVPELYGKEKTSILAMEYWCYDKDAVWTSDDAALIEKAKREIVKTGLTKNAPILEGKVVRVPRCYPVYRRGYKQSVDTVVDYLKTLDTLIPIGRYGAFKYNNQDHSILMGILAAENVALGKKHDLWNVNTDYDSYQEEAVINETGLVPSPSAA
jgi:protoporphyrinogen oxidase